MCKFLHGVFLYFYCMKNLSFRLVFIITLFAFFSEASALAAWPEKNPENLRNTTFSKRIYFHNDSIHQLNFRYADRERDLKPFIAPVALITAGTVLHFSDIKYDLNEWRYNHFNYTGSVDDYLRFAPIAAVYSLSALGIKGKNNFGNQNAILFKSVLLNTIVVRFLKDWTHVERPTGDMKSFPSGHTSLVFGIAQWMHHEYGEKSVWYSTGAYACATSVSLMRIAKGAHWASDILAGAGIGMLTTELVYLTHQYKWDREHLRRLDILPFTIGKQKGLTLVYTF